MTKRLGVALLTVLTLSLGACGSGSGSGSGGDDDKASKAVSDLIMRPPGSGDATQFLSMKRKDADCIGDGFVDKLGIDKLKKYGLVTKDLKPGASVSGVKMSGDDAKSATDVLFGCTDVEAMMQTAMDKSGSIPKTMRRCVDKALSEDNLRPVVTKTFQGQQDEATKGLTGPITKCVAGSNG
jgi:hypothetical protein